MVSNVVMILVTLSIPIIMIILGIGFIKSAPNHANSFLGYRTPMSVKNYDTWQFPQHYCGRLWFKLGWVLFAITAVAMYFLIGKSENTINNYTAMFTMAQTLVLLGSAPFTEIALHKILIKMEIEKTKGYRFITP